MRLSKRTKRLLWGSVAAPFVVAAVLAIAYRPSVISSNNRLPVVATFYPMAEFARQVGGDRVSVMTLVGPGVEPHDYEPTPKEIAGLYDAKVLVYNGGGAEPWVDKLAPDLKKNNVVLAEASAGIPLLAKDPAAPGASSHDPHVWMDPMLAIREVNTIKKALATADPAGRHDYETNARAYIKRLEDLDASFRTQLTQCRSREIFTSHQAFAYLAREYGLRATAIAGLSPDDEPSPQQLANIADFARARGANYIFVETLASPKLSETIAHEIGAQTITFNPLEGLTPDEIKRGKDYLAVQQDNLQSLATALECMQHANTDY